MLLARPWIGVGYGPDAGILMSLERFFQKFAQLPRRTKQLALVAFDATILLFLVWLSYAIRLGSFFTPTPTQLMLMLAAPLVTIPVFVRLGLYRSVIRYITERAMWTIVKATAISVLVWVGIIFLTEMSGIEGVPRSIPLIYWTLSTTVIAGSRFAAKWALWQVSQGERVGRRTLIFGAGETGVQLCNALRSRGDSFVIGFMDFDRHFHGMELLGVRVYPPDQIEMLIENYGVNEVILAAPNMSMQQRRDVLERISPYKIQTRILPAAADLVGSKYLRKFVRDVDIDDLLGRQPVPPSADLLSATVEGRTILVTGAGGSIGSELCRTVAKLRPSKLVLLDVSELALYQIERELRDVADFTLVAELGSVTDRRLVASVFSRHGIETVYHCAAYKHVPIIEENPLVGISNNIFGTDCIASTAFSSGAKNFVLISTDKAVRPSSVMGATKRWSELLVRHYGTLAEKAGKGQVFSSVRFGNVLGSNGSVVPLFREQIARGGPITLTDPDMTRYFMSIREAAELIVQAGALSSNGEILLLEMGDPVNIRDLAVNMIMLAGLSVRDHRNPMGDIEIVVTGKRDGEKLHEELFYDPSGTTPTKHPKIMKAKRMNVPIDNLREAMEQLQTAIEAQDKTTARAVLFDFVVPASMKKAG